MAEKLDTNMHTTRKKNRGTLPSCAIPSYAIRYEEAFFLGKGFFPWKTKKKTLSAARFARLIMKYTESICGTFQRYVFVGYVLWASLVAYQGITHPVYIYL